MPQFLKVAFIAFAMMFLSIQQAQALEINQNDPKQLVEDLSKEILKVLNEQRAELEASPAAVHKFAETYVLPFVDTKKFAQYSTAQYWRSATDEQKAAYVDAFTEMLIRYYSQSFLKLNIERVEVGSVQEERARSVVISTVVVQADSNRTDVQYRAYQSKTDNKWYLYDFAIEGISTLFSFKKMYSSEIGKKGMDAVIKELQEANSAEMAK